MPIAPAKWAKRCARKSTEQRVAARARLLGLPAPPSRPLPTPYRIGTTTGTASGLLYYLNLNGTPFPYQGTAQPYLQQALQQPYLQFLNNSYGSNTMPISTMTQGVWNTWNAGNQVLTITDVTSTGYQSITPQVWEIWNEAQVLTAEQRLAQQAAMAAQNAEYERQRESHNRAYAMAAEEREVAHKKALQLFLSVLKPEELETYKKEECIYVRGSRGRRYRIRCNRSQSGNVDWIDDKGVKLASLCCHPGEVVPNPDAWMVQKLTLEHDEDHFVNLANYSCMPGVRIPERTLVRR